MDKFAEQLYQMGPTAVVSILLVYLFIAYIKGRDKKDDKVAAECHATHERMQKEFIRALQTERDTHAASLATAQGVSEKLSERIKENTQATQQLTMTLLKGKAEL